MEKPPVLSRSQFQASGACDGPAWGPCGLYLPVLSSQPCSTPEPFLPTLRGCQHGDHIGLPLPSSSESTRSYRRGARSLEDGSSTRQPLPKRNMTVGRSSGLWFEGRWQGTWEVELVKSGHIGVRGLSL